MRTHFLIGHHAFNGRAYYLRPDELLMHGLFVGGTRRGKSKFLEHTASYFLRNGIAQVVLDPHGDTARNIIAYAAERHMTSQVIYIDPDQAIDTAVYPLNFLKASTTDVSTQAGYIMQAIAKVFHEENAESKPRLERRERATLMALIEAGYTLADMMDFLRVDDNRFRRHVLKRVHDQYVQMEWEEFDSIQRRADREMMIESCLNRAAKIILNETVRRCLGTDECALDWEKITREGKTLVVNLQPRRVDRQCMQLIGTMIIHHLVSYGTAVEKKPPKPLFVLCDELDELASPDFAYAMQALGKRLIFVWGFIQYLDQLKGDKSTTRLYHSVMANCDLKVAFHASYEDAKLLTRELFAGSFRGDIVKNEIFHTDRVPVESVRRILSLSESETETESSGDTSGHTSGYSHTDSWTTGLGYSTGSSAWPNGTESGTSMSESNFSSTGGGSGGSDSDMDSHTSGSSSGRARAHSETEVPFYEYLERQELSSRTFYSIDELVEKYITFIQCQPQRHAQVKVKDRTAVPLITPFVADMVVRKREVERLIQRSNSTYTLLPANVDKRIQERRLLPAPGDTPETTDDRWQK